MRFGTGISATILRCRQAKAVGDEPREPRQCFRPAWEGVRSVLARPGTVSVVVTTKNEEHNIRDCLASAAWADEIIVCDSGSADRTCKIAAEFTPNVVQHEYINPAKQKNWIFPQASCEWVFSLDADERITPELRGAIQKIVAAAGPHDGYRVRRKTWFLGRPIRHCGWGRDYPLRLFRRDRGRCPPREVHEAIVVDGSIGQIEAPLEHHTDRDLRSYFEKFDRYSTWAAADLFRRGVRARWWHLLLKPPLKFLTLYVLKLGFLDGFHGLLLSGLTAMGTFARYAKLWEMNRKGSIGELPTGRP